MTVATRKAAATIVRAANQKLVNNGDGLWYVGVMRSRFWSGDTAPLRTTPKPIAAENAAIAQLVETDLK
ncbi:MAG TPA: hypothetical protein VF955_04475 [Pyrinomonadaceae bacterium]